MWLLSAAQPGAMLHAFALAATAHGEVRCTGSSRARQAQEQSNFLSIASAAAGSMLPLQHQQQGSALLSSRAKQGSVHVRQGAVPPTPWFKPAGFKGRGGTCTHHALLVLLLCSIMLRW
jgi:hypothetical protein